MAKFTLVHDKRRANKDGSYNLSVRMVDQRQVMYLKIDSLIEKQYEHIFVKKLVDTRSIEYREWAQNKVIKAEKIYNNSKPSSQKRFKELLDEVEKTLPNDLIMKNLFTYYIDNYSANKLKTKIHYRNTRNILEKYKKGLTVFDITPELLRNFERHKLNEGCKMSSITSYLRDIRRIINYFRFDVELIPLTYKYPFSRSGHILSNDLPEKDFLSEEELDKVISFKDFDSPEQEYALDVWRFLYRCGGINICDAVKMEWSNIHGDTIKFERKKTSNTRRKRNRLISVSLTPQLKETIEKIGVKSSPFILGQINEGFTEQTFINRVHKISGKMNKRLGAISDKLSLSVPLKFSKARDCFANSLRDSGVKLDDIALCMGHSNSKVTLDHYIGPMESGKVHQMYKGIK
jgi:integrase/recombinase XerD